MKDDGGLDEGESGRNQSEVSDSGFIEMWNYQNLLLDVRERHVEGFLPKQLVKWSSLQHRKTVAEGTSFYKQMFVLD